MYRQTWLMELGNKRLRQKGPEQVWSLQNSLSNRPFVSNIDLKLALTNKARVAVRAGTARQKDSVTEPGKGHSLFRVN